MGMVVVLSESHESWGVSREKKHTKKGQRRVSVFFNLLKIDVVIGKQKQAVFFDKYEVYIKSRQAVEVLHSVLEDKRCMHQLRVW